MLAGEPSHSKASALYLESLSVTSQGAHRLGCCPPTDQVSRAWGQDAPGPGLPWALLSPKTEVNWWGCRNAAPPVVGVSKASASEMCRLAALLLFKKKNPKESVLKDFTKMNDWPWKETGWHSQNEITPPWASFAFMIRMSQRFPL